MCLVIILMSQYYRTILRYNLHDAGNRIDSKLNKNIIYRYSLLLPVGLPPIHV